MAMPSRALTQRTTPSPMIQGGSTTAPSRAEVAHAPASAMTSK